MRPKLVIVVFFVAAAAAIAWWARSGRAPLSGGRGGASASPPAAEITLLYSSEKRAWIEEAVASFAKAQPMVKVTLAAKGSLEAAQAILDGRDKPTLWSPADSLVLSMLEADWQTKYRSELFAKGGEDAPQSLVTTPLVFTLWEDRAEALQRAAGGAIGWKAIHKAVSSNQGWPALGGKPEWGFVKLGHTDPTRSNSGLQALLLMTYEFYGKSSGLTVGDLLAQPYQAFVAAIEKGVPRFEPATGTLMTDLVRFGPSKYDIAVVYESLVIEQIDNAQGRWGSLRVYYPQTTLWSDHPVALVQGDWVSENQRRAARALLAHLRSRPVQERALAFGFRPADPSVPVRTAGGQNPWTRLAQYGVQVEIPPVASPPDPAVVRNLLMMWSRVVAPR